MVFGIIFRKLQLQLHEEMVFELTCNDFDKNGTWQSVPLASCFG